MLYEVITKNKALHSIIAIRISVQILTLDFRKAIKFNLQLFNYSTVTDLAKFRGWSTLQPRITAI